MMFAHARQERADAAQVVLRGDREDAGGRFHISRGQHGVDGRGLAVPAAFFTLFPWPRNPPASRTHGTASKCGGVPNSAPLRRMHWIATKVRPEHEESVDRPIRYSLFSGMGRQGSGGILLGGEMRVNASFSSSSCVANRRPPFRRWRQRRPEEHPPDFG